MKCESPHCAAVSSREPCSTQRPIAADATPGISSETMRMPFASSVFSIPTSGRASAPAVARPVRGRCRRGWRRSAGSARLRAEGLLAGEADLAALVDLEDFHHHLVALVQHVAHLGDALGRELRDVHETVGAGEDLDEGTEVHDLLD